MSDYMLAKKRLVESLAKLNSFPARFASAKAVVNAAMLQMSNAGARLDRPAVDRCIKSEYDPACHRLMALQAEYEGVVKDVERLHEFMCSQAYLDAVAMHERDALEEKLLEDVRAKADEKKITENLAPLCDDSLMANEAYPRPEIREGELVWVRPLSSSGRSYANNPFARCTVLKIFRMSIFRRAYAVALIFEGKIVYRLVERIELIKPLHSVHGAKNLSYADFPSCVRGGSDL
jgi:hypothetical protein